MQHAKRKLRLRGCLRRLRSALGRSPGRGSAPPALGARSGSYASALYAAANATARKTSAGRTSWARLDHALRATDLLLSTGGFRALVLDMADVPPEQARRVPLATWYRFRLQAEKSRTLFLLMTRVACANSCAARLPALPARRQSTGSRQPNAVRGCSPDCIIASAWSAAALSIPYAKSRRLRPKPSGAALTTWSR